MEAGGEGRGSRQEGVVRLRITQKYAVRANYDRGPLEDYEVEKAQVEKVENAQSMQKEGLQEEETEG